MRMSGLMTRNEQSALPPPERGRVGEGVISFGRPCIDPHPPAFAVAEFTIGPAFGRTRWTGDLPLSGGGEERKAAS
jgi:hypothetical protein